MKSFTDYNLPSDLVESLGRIGYKEPTEIQKKSIEPAINGSDILASSRTGSGKTAAFVIPLIAKISQDPNNTYCLILAPTRELVQQIGETVKSLGSKKIKYSTILGGENIQKQIQDLKKKPNIIIATPGRMKDHIRRKTVKLSGFNMFILDEFDRMLDMGFKEEIQFLSSQLNDERQTLMFSATDSGDVIRLAKKYLKPEHVNIQVGSKEDRHQNIVQTFKLTQRGEKFQHLLEAIAEMDGSMLIFVNTKRCADDLKDMLYEASHRSHAIHGDLRQRERERIIKKFRSMEYDILIATDIVARGIDIDHIKHVVNYDFPRAAEDYVHRIGRTGRFDAKGFSLSFISNMDKGSYKKVTSMLNLEDTLGIGSMPSSGGGGGRRRSGGSSRFGRSGGSLGRSEGRSFGSGERRSDRSFGSGSERSEGRSFGSGERRSERSSNESSDRGSSFGGAKKTYGRSSDGMYKSSDSSSAGKPRFKSGDRFNKDKKRSKPFFKND